MAFLKKVARAVAKEGQVAGRAAPRGLMGKMTVELAKKAASPAVMDRAAQAAPRGRGFGQAMATKAPQEGGRTASKGFFGRAVTNAVRNAKGLKEGGMADKAGRAMPNKTADSMGRAMAKTAMKKGGMAKKVVKKR